MATPSITAERPRARRTLVRLLVALLAAISVAGLVPFGASAEPPASPAEARRELGRLNAEVDEAVEEYAEVRISLAAAQRRAASAQAKVRRAEADLAVVQRGLGELFAAAYTSGGQDEFIVAMTSSTPQDFLDRAATLDQVVRNRTERLRELRALRRRLDAERQSADALVTAQRRLERRLASSRTSIERHVARQEELLDRLESAEARQRRLEAARRSARASRQRVTPAYTGPTSGRAAIAVREAYRQLGKPYRWGAAGPNAFDCSGLTMWVWGKAGVSLPHSSRAQFRYGVRVSKSELRPGDLVFYGSPIHHVGIYVGGGQYIAAPHTGDVVGFRNVNRGDWAGAVRL